MIQSVIPEQSVDFIHQDFSVLPSTLNYDYDKLEIHIPMIRKKQNRFWMMQESLTQMEMESVNWMARISTLDIFLMKTVF